LNDYCWLSNRDANQPVKTVTTYCGMFSLPKQVESENKGKLDKSALSLIRQLTQHYLHLLLSAGICSTVTAAID